MTEKWTDVSAKRKHSSGKDLPGSCRRKVSRKFRKRLVDEVDINRSTFYLHYTDIYQMLQKIEEDAMQNITEVMKKYPIDPDNSDSVLQFIVQFFSIMDNDRDLCLHFSDRTVTWHL